MKLHQVFGRAGKCGPSAIAAIAGCTSDEAARAIRQHNGRKAVNGTHDHDLIGALRLLGWEASAAVPGYGASDCRTLPAPYPTLKAWIACMDLDPDTAWIIDAANHWIVLSWHDGELYAADSGYWFSRMPKPYAGQADRRRVKGAIAVRRARVQA